MRPTRVGILFERPFRSCPRFRGGFPVFRNLPKCDFSRTGLVPSGNPPCPGTDYPWEPLSLPESAPRDCSRKAGFRSGTGTPLGESSPGEILAFGVDTFRLGSSDLDLSGRWPRGISSPEPRGLSEGLLPQSTPVSVYAYTGLQG